MNDKEFKKLIKFEELAKINDIDKFMLKVYLDCLLNGRKIRDNCYLYSCIRITKARKRAVEALKEDQPLRFHELGIEQEKEVRIKEMIKKFNEIKKQGFWIVEEEVINEYDENGEQIFESEEMSYKKPIISKREEITTKTTYYLDKKLDIRELKGRYNGS